MDEKRKAKLGTRWTCYSCAGAFYDLNKPEPICPRCGSDQRDTPAPEPPKAKRKRKAAKKKKKTPKINPRLIEEEEPAEEKAVDANDLQLSSDDDIQLELDED